MPLLQAPTQTTADAVLNSRRVLRHHLIPSSVSRPLVADAIFSRLMDGLTGGPFLAGLALAVGAGTPEIVFLAALPFIGQVVQLPTVALLLRWSDRRRITAATAAGSRAAYLVIPLLLVAGGGLDSGGLLWIMALSTALAVVSGAAWNWWMRDLLPHDQIGAFFGKRLRGATLVSGVVMLVAGFGLDAMVGGGQGLQGYAILFATGGVAGLLGVWALALTPHAPPPPSPPVRETLPRIWTAFRQARWRLLGGLSLVSVSVSFALPFVAIFMLRTLGYSYVAVTVMAVISQLAYLGGLRGWVHMSDRYGDRPVLVMSLGVLATVLLGWAAAGWRPGVTVLVFVGALHFLAGFALSGIELGSNNLLLRTAPADNAPAHLAAVALVRAAAGGLGVLAAGILWSVTGTGVVASFSLPFGTWSMRGFQVLALASVVPCIAGIAAVARLRTPEQPRIAEVARTIRREVSQMSSITGIRALIHAVSYSVEFMAAPFASRLPKRRRKGQGKP